MFFIPLAIGTPEGPQARNAVTMPVIPFFNRCRFGGTGPPAIHAPDFHFFTEYNAPRRRPSGMFVVCNCPALFESDTMIKSSVPPNAPIALPPLGAAYVEATNSFDLERLMATFAEDALGPHTAGAPKTRSLSRTIQHVTGRQVDTVRRCDETLCPTCLFTWRTARARGRPPTHFVTGDRRRGGQRKRAYRPCLAKRGSGRRQPKRDDCRPPQGPRRWPGRGSIHLERHGAGAIASWRRLSVQRDRQRLRSPSNLSRQLSLPPETSCRLALPA
jgi:hypothetical protein